VQDTSSVEVNISVVIPAFNAMRSIELLVNEVVCVAEANSWLYQIVIVDDFSKDATWSLISELCNRNPNILGIQMAKNVGQQAATLTGLRFATGSTVITMDDDFQHAPRDISILARHCSGSAGNFEVVNASVESRSIELPRLMLSIAARLFFRVVLGIKDAKGYSSFRAIDRRVIERLNDYRGPNIALDVLLRWATDSIILCPVSSGPQNPSRYKFRSLLRFAYLTSIGYSKRPLYVSITLGIVLFSATSLALIFILLTSISEGQPPPGYISLLVGLLSFASVQFLLLGALSLYFSSVIDTILGRNHLPIAVVLENSQVRSGKIKPFR